MRGRTGALAPATALAAGPGPRRRPRNRAFAHLAGAGREPGGAARAGCVPRPSVSRDPPKGTARAVSVPRTVPALMTPPVGITAVRDAYGVNYARIMASSVLAALPLVPVFVLFRRHIVKSVATTGRGGQQRAPLTAGRAPHGRPGRGALVPRTEGVQLPTAVLSVSVAVAASSARRSMPLVVFSGFSLMNTTVSSASSAHGVAMRNRSAVATP